AVLMAAAGAALGDGATNFDSDVEGPSFDQTTLSPELWPPHAASNFVSGGITFFDFDHPFNQNPWAVTPVWPADQDPPTLPGESADGEPFPVVQLETGLNGDSGQFGHFYLDFRAHCSMVENANALEEDFDGAFSRPNLLIVGSGWIAGSNFNLSLFTS